MILSWTTETIKVLGSTEYKITKNNNGENAPHLGITDVILVCCNIANNRYKKKSRVLLVNH